MWIKISTGERRYEYQIREENPEVSLPEVLPEDLTEVGLSDYAILIETPVPSVGVYAGVQPGPDEPDLVDPTIWRSTWVTVPLTQSEILRLLTDKVQTKMDEEARAKGYDGIVSACSYAAVANPFQAESQAYLVWRADCWAACYAILAEVQASTRSIPTPEELIAELPVLTLPT